MAPEIAGADLHEVRERDYFFLGGFLLWGALAGLGLAWAWHTLASRRGGVRGYVLTSPVLLVAAIPLVLNWSWATRAGDYAARDWAYDLLMSVEPYGVLFTNGDNDTFPLWYLQEVEDVRKDVTVIVGQYLFTSWYPKQLQALTLPENQRPFDPTPAPGLYEERDPPARPILSFTPEQMDRVGSARLTEPVTISFPGMAVTYPAETFLHRGHQLTLAIIRDSIEERPIFFASTGGIMSELGIERWGVRHGLATKLEFRSLDREQPEEWVQGSSEYGGVWFDLERSLRLYDDVFQYRGIRDRPIWQDRATLNIPWQYYAMALQLSDAVSVARGDVALAQRVQEDAMMFQIVAKGGAKGTPALR